MRTHAARRWLTRFRRQRGPVVRFWDAEWNHLHTEPVHRESWPAWLMRQRRRLTRRNVYRHTTRGETMKPNCPICLSEDPSLVGILKTGADCTDPFHCPSPEFHGNPFRYCPHCNWAEKVPVPVPPHQHCASCPHEWCPKMLREKLCAQESHIPRTGTVLEQRTREAFTSLIEVLDKHRPLGSDGKHGARHTNTCGCDE